MAAFRHLWFGYVLTGVMALVVLVGSMLYSPWLVESLVRHTLSAQKGLQVRRVHVQRQRFSLPGRLELLKVDVTFEMNRMLCVLEIPQIVVTGLQSLWAIDRRVLVRAVNMTARYGQGAAKRMNADLAVDGAGLSGPLTASEVNWDKLRARNASLFLIVQSPGVEFRALKLEAYGGKVTGKMRLDRDNVHTAELLFDGVDPAGLAEVNPALAGELNGKVTGAVSWAGDAHVLRSFDANLSMPLGGRISASLLSALTQYLPPSREKQRLETLIIKGGKVGMEVFALTIKGGEAGKFSGEVHMKSREINLDLDLSHEINTDGSTASLWAYAQKFLK